MPVRRMSAAAAFATMKSNVHNVWPRRDDPDNRFAQYAAPSFKPRFNLEPGQRIFTIGSCFARNIEMVLAERGFDVPTRAYQSSDKDWGGNPMGYLNNFVPASIAPQIRWAFGLDRFDLDRHCCQLGRSRYVDLQLAHDVWPAPPEFVASRRESLNEMYRCLATSHVVLITLGLIEAWFDTRSGLYINRVPPKGASAADPGRFEFHVLDYHDVSASLADLVELLDQVCPRDHRVIFTVSPVPLIQSFGEDDVAVANSYSKSVLRAAVEPFVASHEHIEYFPSYESVILSERALAYNDDQVHISGDLVRFNVERMIRRYVKDKSATVAETLADVREERRQGLPSIGLKRLQQAWADNADDPDLALALAKAHLSAGNGRAAEKLMLGLLETRESQPARLVLARYYNESGRHEEAALQTEAASRRARVRPRIELERAIAYYHLGRFEEGLAVLAQGRLIFTGLHPESLLWQARFCERLGRADEAEDFYRQAVSLEDAPRFKVALAELLASQGRWPEIAVLVDAVLRGHPQDAAALDLRVQLRQRELSVSEAGGLRRLVAQGLGIAWQRSLGRMRRLAGARRIAARAGASLDDV